MSITNGVVPARGVVPAPSTAANDSRHTTSTTARRSLSERLQEGARVAAREHRQCERAPPLQAHAQARILRRLGQPAPEGVEHSLVNAGRAAQGRHAAGRRRRLALVQHRCRSVCEQQAHGRVDRLGRR